MESQVLGSKRKYHGIEVLDTDPRICMETLYTKNGATV